MSQRKTEFYTAFDKIVAGNGTTALTLNEWLAFSTIPETRESFIQKEAQSNGTTPIELLAAAARTTVFVEALVWDHGKMVTVKAYTYEIQDEAA